MSDTSELHYLEIDEVARLLAQRKLSSVELTQHVLRRIERLDPSLRSYARVTPELALAQAAQADRMIGQRQILSQLHGVPIAVKPVSPGKLRAFLSQILRQRAGAPDPVRAA